MEFRSGLPPARGSMLGSVVPTHPCPAGRGTLPSEWGGKARPTSPASGEVNKTGRRLGELFLGRGVRLGEVSACLSLGRGTQRVRTLATICCVPSEVITPNVVGVKRFE